MMTTFTLRLLLISCEKVGSLEAKTQIVPNNIEKKYCLWVFINTSEYPLRGFNKSLQINPMGFD